MRDSRSGRSSENPAPWRNKSPQKSTWSEKRRSRSRSRKRSGEEYKERYDTSKDTLKAGADKPAGNSSVVGEHIRRNSVMLACGMETLQWAEHTRILDSMGLKAGIITKQMKTRGFLQQDTGTEDDLVVFNSECPGFDGVCPPVGTRVLYVIGYSWQAKRYRAEQVQPERFVGKESEEPGEL